MVCLTCTVIGLGRSRWDQTWTEADAKSPCRQSLFSSSWSRGGGGGGGGGGEDTLPESRPQAFDVAAAQTSGQVNLVYSLPTDFFECVHLFINKPKMVITEPAVPSARLLGLTAKLYPSNIVACSFPSTPNSRKRMEGLANRVMQSAFLHAVRRRLVPRQFSLWHGKRGQTDTISFSTLRYFKSF